MDRLHTQLARFEDAFRGFRTEIVEGSVVAYPLRPHHARTIHEVWNALDAQRNEIAYAPDLVELVVEVVSRAGIRRDYEVKPRWYASRGIANYLILDPLKGHCVTMWNPGPDGYLGQDTIAYGPELIVGSPLGKLTLATSHLPVDPKAPAPS
ncbi:Uma2 family endonuclease [Streptomyces sp. HC307]|uniref:Uma2 family endonuclease n=1 Tax=Streptomyces flavusporus TaxID=3385496 RepID=UPI003916DE3B